MIDGCIGDEESFLWYVPQAGTGEWSGGHLWLKAEQPGAQKMNCRLNVGDTDHGCFQPDDPPPFYELDAPRHDREMTNAEKRVERARRETKKSKEVDGQTREVERPQHHPHRRRA